MIWKDLPTDLRESLNKATSRGRTLWIAWAKPVKRLRDKRDWLPFHVGVVTKVVWSAGVEAIYVTAATVFGEPYPHEPRMQTVYVIRRTLALQIAFTTGVAEPPCRPKLLRRMGYTPKRGRKRPEQHSKLLLRTL